MRRIALALVMTLFGCGVDSEPEAAIGAREDSLRLPPPSTTQPWWFKCPAASGTTDFNVSNGERTSGVGCAVHRVLNPRPDLQVRYSVEFPVFDPAQCPSQGVTITDFRGVQRRLTAGWNHNGFCTAMVCSETPGQVSSGATLLVVADDPNARVKVLTTLRSSDSVLESIICDRLEDRGAVF